MGCQNTPNYQVKYAYNKHYFNTPLKPNPVPARVRTLAVQRTRPEGVKQIAIKVKPFSIVFKSLIKQAMRTDYVDPYRILYTWFK